MSKNTKTSSNGQAKKPLYTGAHPKMALTVLGVLAKRKVGSTAQIAETIGTDWPKTVQWAIGNVGGTARPDGLETLLSGKFVSHVERDVDGKTEHAWAITDKGRKLLAAVKAAK